MKRLLKSDYALYLGRTFNEISTSRFYVTTWRLCQYGTSNLGLKSPRFKSREFFYKISSYLFARSSFKVSFANTLILAKRP